MSIKIDLTEELMSRFRLLGVTLEKGSKEFLVVRAFLNINLTKLLGTFLLDENDYELITTKDHLEITSTFYSNKIYFIVEREDGALTFTAVDAITQQDIFMISLLGNIFSNVYYDNVNFIEHSYELDSNLGENYRYRFEEVAGEKKNLLFLGTFYSLNAKYKDKDIFAYSKQFPISDKPRNLMGRIKELIEGEGYVYIPTSFHCLNTLEFADHIFLRLEEQALKEISKEVLDSIKLEKNS